MKHVFNKLLFVYLVCIIPGQLTAMDEAGAALEPAHEHPVPEPNAPAEIELEPFIVNLREGGQHQISRDENETFSLSTFQELETAKSNENKEWIIARVVTRSNQAENGHFFDAHLLNHNLLTDGRFAYPFTNQNPGLALLTNPINGEPANRLLSIIVLILLPNNLITLLIVTICLVPMLRIITLFSQKIMVMI